MRKINVAVVGLGYWGPNIVRNLLKIQNVEKVFGCDLQQENIMRIKKDFPNVSPLTFSSLLTRKDIHAVVIATPLKTHFNLAKEALLANKHVLVEKPMTATSKEAKELIEISKKQKKICMAGHTFVYSEAVKKIKEVISKNQLGKIYYYDSIRINLGLIQKNSNVLWDLAPHDLAILNYIFPVKPLTVAAFGKSFINHNNEEMAHIFITYEKGITAHIHVSWLSPVKVRTILIGGSKKMIMYNDIEPSEKIRLYDKGISIPLTKITPFAPAYRSGDIVIPRIEQTETLLSELSHFVYCIQNNQTPLTDVQEGAKVVLLLEAIQDALRKKSVVSVGSL
jgi:predicted dehydrogenase